MYSLADIIALFDPSSVQSRLSIPEDLNASNVFLLVILICFPVSIYVGSVINLTSFRTGIPVAGRRSVFEPDWLARLRFIRGSRGIINEGYKRYHDLFIVRKSGTDIVVIGNAKFVDEIRAQTKEKMRSVEPFLHDFVGAYTGGKIICDSDVQNRVLMQRVTPNLETLIPEIKSELQFALQKELPQCDREDWVEVDVAHVFPRIVARITARILLGPTECRNEKWLQTTADYTENVFITGFVLRFVPRMLRPFVAAVLPTYWKLFSNLSSARSIIGASASRRAMKRREDVLQWIMDFAKPDELENRNLTERMLVLSLSGIHTTALTTVQALYDLCARPDDFSKIHTELKEVVGTEKEWNKGMLLKMLKLDSLLKESQRLNPVFLLTFNRILPCAVTLSNGVHLPAGTRVAVPQNAILNCPKQVPGQDPSVYDPWRYAKLRENPQDAQKHQFAMVDASNMPFGYGRYACPGRFFVATEIKMLLAHLLVNFDWKLPDGSERPRNFTIDSDMYPDRKARLLVRRRKVEDQLQTILGV